MSTARDEPPSAGATPSRPAARRSTHHLRAALAWSGVAFVAVLAGLWFTAHPPPRPVDLGEASLAQLDTVALDGRAVTAIFGGTVTAVGAGDAVWVGSADHAIEVRGAGVDSLTVEDRVLVDGEVRAGEDGRWIEAEAVTRVDGVTLGVPRRSGETPTVQPEE